MTLVHFYYDPVGEFDRLFEDVLATRVSPRGCSTSKDITASRRSETYRPRLNLVEPKDGDTVTATFELPGLTSNDVTIDVQQNPSRLTISGTSVSSDAPEDRTYVVRERRVGKFSRTLQLPFGTKPEEVKAQMENGVLTVTFPKTSPEQQAQRIVVQ